MYKRPGEPDRQMNCELNAAHGEAAWAHRHDYLRRGAHEAFQAPGETDDEHAEAAM